VIIEDAREFLKNLAADGQDAYLDRIWDMRYPVQVKPSSKGWPYKPASEQEATPRRLKVLK
jgi:hypothetical protein